MVLNADITELTENQTHVHGKVKDQIAIISTNSYGPFPRTPAKYKSNQCRENLLVEL